MPTRNHNHKFREYNRNRSSCFNYEINIYPNPVVDILFITTPEYYTVDIYSKIEEKTFSTKENQIEFSRFNAGVYFAVIKNRKSLKSIKILKRYRGYPKF